MLKFYVLVFNHTHTHTHTNTERYKRMEICTEFVDGYFHVYNLNSSYYLFQRKQTVELMMT